MYCLDTNIIVALFRGDKDLEKKLREVKSEDVFFTAVTLCELFKGAYKHYQREKSLLAVDEFARNYTLLGLTVQSCEVFGRDFDALDKKGKRTEAFDLLTASIAKANDLIVVTRNRRHFEHIPDLRVEEW